MAPMNGQPSDPTPGSSAEPMTQPSAPANTSFLGAFRAAPAPVRVLALLVFAEAAALVVIGLVQTVLAVTAEHEMPLGAIALMSLLYIGYGLWLLAGVLALCLGRLWSRALILLTQIFLAVISMQMASMWGWPVAIWAVIYAVVTVTLLFSGQVQHHLLSEELRR